MKSQIYGHKDIHANTLGQKNYENENIKNDDQRIQLKVNMIKINIDKNIIKDNNKLTWNIGKLKEKEKIIIEDPSSVPMPDSVLPDAISVV